MADGGNVPQLGGYDYEFISRVPDDLECLVCHLTMKDPVQIVGCGHRLCNICMESLLRRHSATCPADRQPLSREKIFPDAACHRRILDLTVKCSYSECLWTGELRAVEKHQSECPFKVVKCPNSGCTEKLTKQALQGHVAFECSWRKINCEYCQESFILNQKQEHLDVCGKFPVQCPNNCGLRDTQREKLDVHVRDECPATEVQCEYKNLGCKAEFPRSDAKSHSETQVERHLNLALRGLEATQLQVHELVNLVKDQSQQIKQQTQQIERQSQQIERLEKNMSKVKENSQQIERLDEDFFTLKEQTKQNVRYQPTHIHAAGCRQTGTVPRPRLPKAIQIPGLVPLSPSVLAVASPQDQKQMLGERLFPLIQATHPDQSGKITGMLLDLDNAELLHMLESREALQAKVLEAVSVLRAHNNMPRRRVQK